MNKKSITIGVTGHRDLDKMDKEELSKKIEDILLHFKNCYKDLYLISALAEGADSLVAKIALKVGYKLIVYIPFCESEYVKSFSNKNHQKEYFKLKNLAIDFKVICLDKVKSKDLCYQKLGKEIVDNSDYLLALWDRVDNKKIGGTADVVKYKMQKNKQNSLIIIDIKR